MPKPILAAFRHSGNNGMAGAFIKLGADIMAGSAIESLNKLLGPGFLSKNNAERTARIFCDAARLVYERQKRLNRDQLKMRDISSALLLADFIHDDAFRFDAVGDLGENLKDCPEEQALRYYEERVMGTVKDKHERSIRIDEHGLRLLYKDPQSGDHFITSENYEPVRGKRLPWIRHTLQNSHTICVSEQWNKDGTLFRRSYLYFAIVSVPIKGEKKVSYYVVVTKEEKKGELSLVTAYGMFEWGKFLNVVENTAPYGQK